MEHNLARVHEAVEFAYPDRPCIVFHDRHMSYRTVGDRTRQLANALLARGVASPSPRDSLGGHRSGQAHLALYLHNGNEYLEGMIGAYKARVAPFNVNYRYVAEELRYLLDDSGARAILYHSAFAPVLDEVRGDLPDLTILWQVADESGHPLLDGAEWYEDALAAQPTELADSVRDSWSPDDLYILYTGGTTGMPKGVLWRQADIFVAALGGRQSSGEEWSSIDEIVTAAEGGGAKMMPAPPFMHGAAHWMAFNAFTGGNTIVIPNVVERFDPIDVLDVVADQSVNVLLIVGDAFGRPLVEELESSAPHDTSSLLALVSGGAALSAGVKTRLLEAVPAMMVLDGLGASETGAQAYQTTAAGQSAETGTFSPGPGMCILSDDLSHLLEPGDDEMGWLGQVGRVPLGYLGDAPKTAKTFPGIDGVRYAVPGDRARVRADGTLELFGRDSVTINTGGEKVFAEEVEAALTSHPDVNDVIVCGRPSARWGSEVVAIVELAAGATTSDEELLEEAERHVARYKLPKAIIRRERLQRSPSGKADYRWARAQADNG
jgi:fatty-acyl-CoA synthase